MEVYNIRVENLNQNVPCESITRELKKLYAVKGVNIDHESSVVRIVMEDYGSIYSCLTILDNLGFPECKKSDNKKTSSKRKTSASV